MWVMPFPPGYFCLLLIFGIFAAIRKFMKDSQRAPRVEINYERISESRRQAARNRANPDGFIPLGDGRRHLTTDITWRISPGKQNLCRIENNEICFYVVGNIQKYLAGEEKPVPSDEPTFNIKGINSVRAWYKPQSPYLRIGSEIVVPELGENFVEFWSDRLSKRDYTDALILLRERIEAAQRK